jgi:hypothetical protein
LLGELQTDLARHNRRKIVREEMGSALREKLRYVGMICDKESRGQDTTLGAASFDFEPCRFSPVDLDKAFKFFEPHSNPVRGWNTHLSSLPRGEGG